MFHFCTLQKDQKTSDFLCFLGVQKWNIGWKWVKIFLKRQEQIFIILKLTIKATEQSE